MSNNKTKRLVGIALLSALAYVLTFIEIPLVPTAPFLKLDFSEIPIFFGMYVFGPLGGTVVALIRSLLQYVTTGGDAGFPIGATAQFIASLSLNLPLYFIIINNKFNLKNKVFAGVAGTISLTIVLSIVNWLFVLPAYLAVMGLDVGPVREYLIYALIPFNLLKGLIVTTIAFALTARMKPWLDKMRMTYSRKKIDHLNFEN